MVKDNLEGVRRRVAAACRASGRQVQEVRLVAVTKGVPTERIQEAVACGLKDLGENRVQEAREKIPLIGSEVCWHLVGHLQRNKAKPAVELFDLIHSVDSLGLVEELERQSALRQSSGQALRRAPGERSRRKLQVLIQVNVSGEATKYGCRPEEAERLAEAILRAEHLKWAGLMTMAPFSKDPESARPFFRMLRELRDDLAQKFSLSGLDLSMGMSHDFEVAIEEGATMVRIGTAIFGEIASPPRGSQ